MKCSVCGNEIAPGKEFCQRCGTRINWESEKSGEVTGQVSDEVIAEIPFETPREEVFETSDEVPFEAASEMPEEDPSVVAGGNTSVKSSKKGVILVGILLVIGIAAGLFFMKKPTAATVDLNPYVHIEFLGDDNFGEAVYEFDTAKLDRDYGDVIEGSANDFLAQCVRGYFKNGSGLSNGDTVTFVWDCDDKRANSEFKVKLAYQEITETVHGLEDPAIEEIFVDYYVQKYADISSDVLEDMKNKAQEEFKQNVTATWDSSQSLLNLNYIGYTFWHNVDIGGNKARNRLFLAYKVQLHNYCANDFRSYDKSNEYYWYAEFRTLKNDQTGKTTVNLSKCKTPSHEFEIKSGIDSINWTYNGYVSRDGLIKAIVDKYQDDYEGEVAIDESKVPQIDTTDHGEVFDTTSGQIFPDSSERELSSSEIASYTSEELQAAVNEIFARKGYIFKDDSIRRYYEQYSWYNPTIRWDKFEAIMMNSYEIANRDKLVNEITGRTYVVDMNEEGILFPDSSMRVLSDAEIQSMADENVQVAINEIFARHGYIFGNPQRTEYYKRYSWYNPRIPKDLFDDPLYFNTAENKNVANLANEQKTRPGLNQ